MLKWESAQLSYRLQFLFLGDGTSDWPSLARGGTTVHVYGCLVLRDLGLKTKFYHYSQPI